MSNKKIAPFLFSEKKSRRTPLGKFVEDKKMPLLVLRDIVLFPETSIAITSLSSSRIAELSKSHKNSSPIAVVTGIAEDAEDKTSDLDSGNISRYGTEALIVGVLKMKNGDLAIIIKGQRRFVLNEVVTTKNK
jgi:ATP-dependent Lon protease